MRGLALALVLLGLVACGRTEPKALTPVTVQLAWLHQVSTAGGLYAADQNGDYAAEGLTVSFLTGGPKADPLDPLVAGTVRFAVANADQLLLARAAGKPVRAIATIFRRSPVVFVTLASSGIRRPQDFAGKTIRVTSQLEPSLHAMMARVGIDRSRYATVMLPSDVAEFASGRVPVWGFYLNGLVVTLERAGHRLNLIFPDDYGVHFYGETLVTTDELIGRDPDLVLRFLRASLKGWRSVVVNPHRSGALILKYAPAADVEDEARKLVASLPLVNTGDDAIGWTRREVLLGMERILRGEGVLERPVAVDDVHTLRFLEAVYPGMRAQGAAR